MLRAQHPPKVGQDLNECKGSLSGTIASFSSMEIYVPELKKKINPETNAAKLLLLRRKHRL